MDLSRFPSFRFPSATCTIVTTEANELLRPIYGRMPVILGPEDEERWLGGDNPADLLKPYSGDDMEAYPVSQTVNSPANEEAQCINPLTV